MDFALNFLDKNSRISIQIDEDIQKLNHSTTDLVFIIEGKIFCPQTNLTYCNSDFLIFNRFEDYELKKQSQKSIYLIIEIADTLLRQALLIDNLSFNCDSVSQREDVSYSQLRQTVYKIFELILLNEYRANFLIYSCMYELLNIIIGNYSMQSTYVNAKDVKNREIIKYIYLHYAEDIGLVDIAQQFYMDPNYFSKYFKKHFGVNYKDYLLNTRMSFAEKDLIYTENSMVRIATDNGFSNISSFNRAFNKYYSLSPSAYREQYQIQVEAKKASQIDYLALNERYKKIQTIDITEKVIEKDIVVEASRTGLLLEGTWRQIINIGRAKDLLNDGVQKQLQVLNKELSFVSGRIWSVFSDDLYIDWHKGVIRNFDKLNLVFDNLLELNLIPWITINKKAPLLVRMTDIPSFTFKKWKAILLSFMYHMVDRYGIEQVEKWKFEIVIENIQDKLEIERFGEIFQATVEVVKNISESIQVGGAGFKGGVSEDALTEIAEQVSIETFDFYSMLAYPYYSKNRDKEARDTQRITRPDYLEESVHSLLQTLEIYPKKPIYISEWNMTVSNHNLINDSRFKGVYIIRNVLAVLDKVAGSGYWGALDLNYIHTDDTAFLTGASGLVNKFGMQKTAYIAFRFLKEIENRELIKIGENYAVCRSRDELHIIFFNYVHPNQLYFLKRENDIQVDDIDKFFDSKQTSQDFVIQNLEEGSYEVRTYTCDEANASLFDSWKKFNYSNDFRRSDFHYMRTKNFPSLKLRKEIVTNGRLLVQETLKENCFCMINVIKRQK